ncbi:NAD(P)/FAD-dependent oxidoreductase [Paenibacillus spongiae]|uniref:NAD(P)/FAD-dependent oxidoreductase n=1 Tax=Paenibacillus spongiae TaxID=2909671 RepID=A0ABY5S4P7_9BACL|nr:NAD(P)/FAD-dependent oxidoreductase [Paenibacillus spongiae]UVI28877.1 NAD(P)/FAD-dependent oxidoreductase [Paenibacillus spongiae]
MNVDCAIVGGGIAGLQAAIQLGRYRRNALVIDAHDGRSVLCRSYNNLLGWPEGVSGQELRELGRSQAEKLGIKFMQARVEKAERSGELFQLTTDSGTRIQTKRLLLATGIMDRLPELPGLLPCLGRSIYVCPDCDGYEISGKRTVVLGSGQVGAEMAITLAYWSQDLIYINHEAADIDEQQRERLQALGIDYVHEAVASLITDGDELRGLVLDSGRRIAADKGFVAMGGNQVRSELAQQLGVTLHDNRHILANPRTKMTNAIHVWSAGDVVAHSEQVSIAMGDGAQAAIWMHKSLLGIPVPTGEQE